MFTHPDSAGASPSRLNFDFPLSPKYFFPVCCRYSETVDPMMLADVLAIDACTYEFEPRPMIYPAEVAPVIVSENGRTEIRPMRWGLIPHWAKDESLGKKLFNARVERAAQKPAFRDAWKKRRCLIPATGFYEWNHNAATDRKQPYHFHLPDNRLFCFAGLWETWETRPPEQPDLFGGHTAYTRSNIETFTILTTKPNELVSKFHDRMPVIHGGVLEDWVHGFPNQNNLPKTSYLQATLVE